MAVDIGKLVAKVKETISFDELSGKSIAIDAYNTIYQFISIIRQPDGTPLTDSKNMVTSHLSGLFYRSINLMEHGIRPIYIFDGTPPQLKSKTLEARMSRRENAYEEWQRAKEKGLLEEARTYAMASSRISKEIIATSKEVLRLMGIPYIQAPSEGEAQAANMVKQGLVYAAASQDYDLFLFGTDVAIRNLTITGKRKLPKKNIYVDIGLERIFSKRLLDEFGITRKQLIWLGILVGTDFDEGIEGIGPMNALKIVKKYNSIEEIEKYVREKYGRWIDVDATEVEQIFENPEVADISGEELERIQRESKVDKEALTKFMCDEHDFTEERIGKYIDKLVELRGKQGQKGISSWI